MYHPCMCRAEGKPMLSRSAAIEASLRVLGRAQLLNGDAFE